MVDMTTNLGREVITTTELLQLIRPELRIIRAHYRGLVLGMRTGQIDHDEDLNATDGGDSHAIGAVFTALRESAMGNVVDWCRDMDRVFDKAKVAEFIRQALIAAEYEGDALPAMLPADAVDY